MTYEEIFEKLNMAKNFSVVNTEIIPHGKAIILSNGGKVNCYNSGKHVVQGKSTEEINAILLGKVGTTCRRIFVVYGHDEIVRTQLDALLRRWDLEPIILDQQSSGGQTIIEKLEEYSQDIAFAIVLATPDDEGKANTESEYKKRVRQNVVLELGMLLAKLGRDKVAILLKEAHSFEKPSDIQGLVYIPFQNRIDEVSINLIRELHRAGLTVETSRV